DVYKRQDLDSDYGVSFPDFPGCVSGGETVAEAITMAEDALALHLEGLAEAGQPIADPTPADAVVDAPEVNRVALVMIPADRPGRMVRVNVTLEEGLLARIDRTAGPRGRSAFLAQAADRALRQG
ncbi:MAG TPA: CopG family transcriptional regulator, partial [Rhodospirillum rubrum]|nr:CopG family transcriptional regulator [Rhodospirillum rubrum]